MRDRVRTTVPDSTATERADDLVERQFKAERPNQLWVADFSLSRPGAASTTWSTPRSSGWPGSTRSACWSRSGTFPPAEYREQLYRAQTAQAGLVALN